MPLPFLLIQPICQETKYGFQKQSNVDAISGETILGSLAAEEDVSYSMLEMFQGSIPGSIAETSALWVAVGALI